MALKNPLGKIKDAAFWTLKYPIGAAGKAVGTVSDVVGARRLPPTEPAPAPPQEPLPPRMTGPVSAREPAGRTESAGAEPPVDATPADVAAVVEKKAPARKKAAKKAPTAKKTARTAPAKKSAAKKAPARKAAAQEEPVQEAPEQATDAGTAADGPGGRLPFPPRDPEPEADAPADSEPLLDPAVAKSVASEAEVAQRGAEVTKD